MQTPGLCQVPQACFQLWGIPEALLRSQRHLALSVYADWGTLVPPGSVPVPTPLAP